LFAAQKKKPGTSAGLIELRDAAPRYLASMAKALPNCLWTNARASFADNFRPGGGTVAFFFGELLGVVVVAMIKILSRVAL
jgi:hypothetical protein